MHTTDRWVIDLHCDTLTAGYKKGHGLISKEMDHISLDRLPDGLRWCQCFAIFLPDELRGQPAEDYFRTICDHYDSQLRQHAGKLLPLTETDAIPQALEQSRFASILTVEGGCALAGKLENVEKMYRRGVRMMTLTWNAANEIAGGVGSGEGFTPFGRRVVAEMERVGMAVDVSHLSDKSFWELCDFASKPFLASHSNARPVCGHRRNLTDDMFREIVRRGGVVGLNYCDDFIVDGGGSASVDDLLRHLHHFLDLGGENTVALGSDYDGATLPAYLGGLDKFTCLLDALDRSGLTAATVDKILFGNANRYLSGLRA